MTRPTALFFGLVFLIGRSLEAQGFQDAPPGFSRVGTFRGAPSDDFGDAFENEIFREARTGELFQELGDIEIGLGGSWKRASLDATLAFSRRVLMRQRELPDGSTIGDDATSGFRTLNQATAKSELPLRYLSEHSEPFHIGLRATSGFVLSVAETQPVRPLPNQLVGPPHAVNLRDELSGYWHSRDVRFRRNIFPRVGRTIVALVGALSSLLERNFEDTERGSVYFEGMVEPLTLHAELGFPLRPELFTSADTRLSPGDGASYTTFIGLSPFEASVRFPAARASLEYFLRMIRETTVIELPGDKVLVRTRTQVSRGEDLTPLKIRPEIRLLLLRYGYTFFHDRRQHSHFRTNEVIYRFDLADPTGRVAFAAFLGADQRVRLRPALDAASRHDGVEMLLASTREGKRNDLSRQARFPSWFRSKNQDLSVDERLEIAGRKLLQASRGSSRSLRVSWPFTRRGRRDRSQTSVIELQAKPRPDERVEGDRAFEVRSTYRNRAGAPDTARRFGRLLQKLPDARIEPEVIAQLAGVSKESRGLVAALRVAISGPAFERFLAFGEPALWRTVTALLLGEERAGEWQTAGQRALFRKAGERRERKALREAESFVEHCARMRERLSTARVTRPDWFRGSASASEITLLQAAMLAAAKDLGERPYYRIEIWSDGRPRPWTWSSGRSPFNRPAGWTLSGASNSAPLPGVADISGLLPGEAGGAIGVADNIRSSPTRLLAGVLYRSEASPVTYRLSLFSNLKFQGQQRLRFEVRRSRIRADIPLGLDTVPLPEPVPVPQGPFAVSLFRYDLDLPSSTLAGLTADQSYSLSLRVINPQSMPLTEQQLLRFRLK
jgi:hypothetical protein